MYRENGQGNSRLQVKGHCIGDLDLLANHIELRACLPCDLTLGTW